MISIDTALEHFWHPVCTVAEMADRTPRPLGVRLLGRELAVARVGPDPAGSTTVTALADRCPHRSTRLSVGWVEGCGVRCAYHGWLWSPTGECLEIPSMPDRPIPGRAVVDAYEARLAYDLVWVRIRAALDVAIPPNPAWEDASMRVLCGAFWFVSRDDDLDGDDSAHLAFQARVLSEDEPVVCNQMLPELDLDVGAELSVRTDRVSVEYRRWLRELASAAELDEPADALRTVLGTGSGSARSSEGSGSGNRAQPVGDPGGR